MRKTAIKVVLLGLMVLMAMPSMAQITSVRDINAIPEAQLMALQDAAGEGLTQDVIDANIFNPDVNGAEFNLVVVVLSDARKSGLANLNNDGVPSRVHMFVRDTSAATLGFEGMGIQLVDGAYSSNGLLEVGPGDVIAVTGSVSPFGTTMQIAPSSPVTLLGSYSDLGLPESIIEPVEVTSDQVNSAVGMDGVQVNWSNLADLRGQFVRLSGATIQARSLASADRPDFYVSTDDGATVINFYDTGLQFRNDRSDYPDDFLPMDEDFVPPPPGSVVDIQGFLLYQPGSDQIGRGVPADGMLSMAPFNRDGCEGATELGFGTCDIILLESPPVIAGVTGPDFVPDGTGTVAITFTADADPSRTITDTFCEYTTSDSTDPQTVAATAAGDGLQCDIPAQADGVFTVYAAGATDSEGATSLSETGSYRTLVDGIDSIEDIQLTIDEGPGNSPFTGITTDMAITATVQTTPSKSTLVVVQDNADLAPWSGIFLSPDGLPELNPGDVVNITNATVERRNQFGFNNETWLTGVTLEVMSTGGSILGYKAVNTGLLQDESIAKAHEGMLLRFDNVKITDNDTGFGQWAFATIEGDTTQAPVQADDVSPIIAGGTDYFAGGETLEFIQGPWLFAFGSFRILPEDPATDIGFLNVANEDDVLPETFALHQNFPNPFNPTTSISYQISQPGAVLLEVFDTLGRRVATLVDGQIPAGLHTATFDATDLSSGMYLYRLQAGDNVTTRKMVLLK